MGAKQINRSNLLMLSNGNVCVTFCQVIEVLEYVTADGRSPYAKWFNSLNAQAAARVTITVTRMAQGNFSNTKSVGAGIQECRIDFGSRLQNLFW